MRVGKDAGVAKILVDEDSVGRNQRGASSDSTKNAKHAGMGALVTPWHVITCAHVVNLAIGRDKADTRKPSRPVNVVFPLSSDPSTIVPAHVVKWYEFDPKKISDIAVLQLDMDPPSDTGLAVFGLIRSALDTDELSVFGALGGQPTVR
jgi:hypothetical protein